MNQDHRRATDRTTERGTDRASSRALPHAVPLARTGRVVGTLVAALVVSGVLGVSAGAADAAATGGGTDASAVTSAPATRVGSALRDRIVSVARGEVGVREGSAECDKYFPGGSHTCRTSWCAAFAEWTWRKAGVKEVPTDLTGRGVGAWGQKHHLWHDRGAARPEPGDLVVYGKPAPRETGGHVAVVVAVHGDGTIDTVDGNYGDKVTLRSHLDPEHATGGAKGLPVTGYVTPPGA
ncbi:CHAP domain-containing protein [Kitasatospora sp. NPDC004745]|uniref:CHAP domain-containing protein n=1 Tax=Kitasatospora sp. NPDC004745 TaxID=3364019 RepID=UPI003687771E